MEEVSIQNCSNNDVLLFEANTFKLDKFQSVVAQSLKQIIYQFANSMRSAGVDADTERNNHEKWLNDGIECQILKPGATDWQKGTIKLKLVIEFHPDSSHPDQEHSAASLTSSGSDPSLDALRQMVIEDH
jgi:hypothetical protein